MRYVDRAITGELVKAASGYDVTALVVHPGRAGTHEPAALTPGVRSITDNTLQQALESARRGRASRG